jgi:hypothetical protein
MISAPQGGKSSARLVLAVEFMIAILCRGTAVFAGPLPGGDSVMGGQMGVGSPLGEIRGAPLEPTLPI